jgi:hypothetical protein
MTEQDIISALKYAKPLYAAVSGVLTLLLGKSHVSPFDEDMPVPMKTVLVCIAIAEIYLIDSVKGMVGARWLIAMMALAVIVFLMIYLVTYQLFGYDKILPDPKKGWFGTTFRYKQVKILGGLWLQPAAQQAAAENQVMQDFLADNAYNQDLVWSRWSRAPVQIVAVLSYVLLVISLVGVLAFAVGV